jgi:hypothetical protein
MDVVVNGADDITKALDAEGTPSRQQVATPSTPRCAAGGRHHAVAR